MLAHPWGAAVSDDEWRDRLGTTALFGQLIVNNADPSHAPLAIPSHAVLEGEELWMHLATPNPVWPHVEATKEVRFTVVGDYAYIPSTWRAKAGGADEDGVPTSYYATVQFICRPEIVDDPEGKAALLLTQFAHIQPEGDHAPVETEEPPTDACFQGSEDCVSISSTCSPSSSTTTTTPPIIANASPPTLMRAATSTTRAQPRNSVVASVCVASGGNARRGVLAR